METSIIRVEGMSCQHCVNTIKKAVGEIIGVSGVNMDLQAKKVTVEWDPKILTLESVKKVIEDQGYEVIL